MKALKDKIGMCFPLIDLGPISWLLSMKVMRDGINCTISLSQELYVNVILMKYNFSDVKPVAIRSAHSALEETVAKDYE